jgi:hypothetical protein
MAVAVALVVTGCSSSSATHSTPTATRPTPGPTASTLTGSTRSASTTASSSAFCLDLTPFQVVLVVFRGDVAKAVHDGTPLDLADLRARAATIARMGQEMRASAPPEIAAQFRTVLAAVAASAAKLQPGGSLSDVVAPLFGQPNAAAFDAVDKYGTPTCGPRSE